MARIAGVLGAAALAAALFVAPASAGTRQRSLFQDDRLLVYSGDATRDRTLDDIRDLGADAIHSVVFWDAVAPYPDHRRPPAFDASDPAAYPAQNWDKYDGLVRGAAARGLDVVLSPASPIPAWASGCRGSVRVRRTCDPNPTQFRRFVQALGTRYSGTYRDEDEGRTILPRVRTWSIWNEPNQGGWLTPQAARVKGRLVPQSPAIYRALVRAAIAGLRTSGHGHDAIWMGETAPLGRVTGTAAQRPTPPTTFLRDVFCIDAAGRALTGATAAALDCAGFRRLAVTGISHHPYTRGGSQPPTAAGGPTEITISSSARLKTIMREAAARGRIRGGLPIEYTEFGFQTNPPDTIFGVSLARQAAYLNESDWIAYRDPDVASVAQYELRDEPTLASFQTGLRFLDGRPKPSWDAYRLPIWVTRSGGALRVWGQVRPLAPGATGQVEIQNDPGGTGAFTTVATVTTKGAEGFVDARVGRAPGTWRLQWTPPGGGAPLVSRVAGVGR